MKVAFLFPGQDAGVPWGAWELATRTPGVRRLFRVAGEELGEDLLEAVRRRASRLERTSVLQPALTALCLGVHEALGDAGIEPALVAGHSLGELSAWAAAGHARADDAVRIAALRGRLMEEAAVRQPGSMLALTGIDRVRLEQLILQVRPFGTVEIAAHNGPEDWTLSGPGPALDAIFSSHGARRLRVTGPWHSQAMAGAEAPLAEALRSVQRTAGAPVPFVCNRTGRLVETAGSLPALLAGQLTHPICWFDSMMTLDAAGVTDYVTVGPGRVLRSFVRRNLGTCARVHGTEQADDVQRTLERLCR